MERLFSIVCYFLSHFCWSLSCVKRVSKIDNFFLTCSETEPRCIFEGFQFCHLWKVQFQLSSTFFSFFFIWSVNCLGHFFSPFLLVSKLYELNLRFQKFKHEFIFERFQYCYLSKVRFVLFRLIQGLFRLLSGLQIAQFWSVNYDSFFRSFQIYGQC